MSTTSDDQLVDLNEFASLAGFPVELIKKELVLSDDNDQKISMAELREAMLKYLDHGGLK